MVTILKDILFAWDDSNDYKTRVESDNTKKMFFFFFLLMMSYDCLPEQYT